MITIIQKLHSIGYIYNDLKGDNICVGLHNEVNPGTLRLIDFGMCSKYREMDGSHIEYQRNKAFRGNLELSSQNALNFEVTSRRDDIISVFYFMAFLTSEEFMFLRDETLSDYENLCKLQKLKQVTTVEEICQTSNCNHFIEFGKLAYSIEFDEEPNYNKLRFLLEKNLLQQGIVPTRKICFEQ